MHLQHHNATQLAVMESGRIQDDAYRAFLPPIVSMEGPLEEVSIVDQSDDFDIENAVEELLRLNQTSLHGYQELLQLVTEPRFRGFVEVMVRQRAAQCANLRQLLGNRDPQAMEIDEADAEFVDPQTTDLRVAWLRAIWNFEQQHFRQFADQIELAESILEEACLIAAETILDADVATLFREYAINVCGARQRLEELAK